MVESNWCEACQEACHDHPSMCSVCGTPLTDAPDSSANQGAQSAEEERWRTMEEDSQYIRDVLEGMGRRGSDLEDFVQTIRNNAINFGMNLPPEALDPQQASGRSRPTSKSILDNMARIILNEHSTLFRQATLKVGDESNGNKFRSIDCTLGEFGSAQEYKFTTEICLVVASPLTGKGGLDQATKARISELGAERRRVILFMTRGGDVTFVQKARMAQDAGAAALVIGNNRPAPWPYVMKDSKGESKKPGQSITIPVAMIKEEESKKLVKQFASAAQSCLDCELTIRSQSTNCPVCCEDMQTGETVVQLPGCGHVFHEECALTWLKSHNTCPYCRLELPTDDPQYEEERRRRQQQGQANEAGNDGGGNGASFYG